MKETQPTQPTQPTRPAPPKGDPYNERLTVKVPDWFIPRLDAACEYMKIQRSTAVRRAVSRWVTEVEKTKAGVVPA